MSTAYDPLATDDMADKPTSRHTKRANKFEHYASKVYGPLGFKKWYNFVFFFIFAQALFYFCWYNIRKIDVRGYWIKHAMPAEQFFFRLPRYSIGMQMHLGCECRHCSCFQPDCHSADAADSMRKLMAS